MTVGDLIYELEKFPTNLEVLIPEMNYSGLIGAGRVRVPAYSLNSVEIAE